MSIKIPNQTMLATIKPAMNPERDEARRCPILNLNVRGSLEIKSRERSIISLKYTIMTIGLSVGIFSIRVIVHRSQNVR